MSKTHSWLPSPESCRPCCRRPGCCAEIASPQPANEGDQDYCEEHMEQVRALRSTLLPRAAKVSELHWPVAARR